MQIRLGFYIVLLASIVGAVGFLLWREHARTKELTELRAKAAEQEVALTALEAQARLLDSLIQQKVQREVARRTARAVVENAVEEAAREEPIVRDFVSQRIPDGLRQAYVREADQPKPVDVDGSNKD